MQGRGRGAQPEPGALGLARAALAHPRQARPGGALGLSRGAEPGRGCGVRCCSRTSREHQRAPPRTASPALTNSSCSLSAICVARPAAIHFSLSLSSPSSQPTSACNAAAPARPQRPLTASRRASSTAAATRRPRPPPVSQLRQHLLANARAASHILGRPGPGEPPGFLVVPGRADGVARPALRAVLLTHFALAPARPSSHRLARAHQLLLLALRPLRRASRRYAPLSLSLSLFSHLAANKCVHPDCACVAAESADCSAACIMHGHKKHAAAAGEWFTPRAVRRSARCARARPRARGSA